MNPPENVVIIGCSGTGALAARMLKKLQPSLNVTIIREKEEKGLLTRCATPYICCGNVLVDPSYKDDSLFTDAGIRLVNAKAAEVDKAGRTVKTIENKTYPYDKLVLATGSKPVTPPIAGVDLPGVFKLRTSQDAYSMLHWMNTQRVKRAVLVGGGAIGIEIAYLTAQKGVKIELVEMQDHILEKALDPDMSADVEEYIKARGTGLRLHEKVDAVEGTDRIERVVLASGEKIDAQMLVLSAGTVPRVELALQAGLEIGTAGLRVNEYLQTSDPDIYAAGDMIEYPSFITGKPILGQLRPNAVIGGRIIAKNILGHAIEFPPLINSFATKYFDKSIAGTGITELQARSEGIDVIGVTQASASQHSMMPGKKPYTVKLVFNRKNQRIIGGQIVSDSSAPIKNIDTLAVAIRSLWTATQLTGLRCAGQPELSPDPGAEPIALAAETAYGVFGKKS